MKVAVYTIALNEEQFVEPWFESAKEADYLLIADTGSTDKTIEKAKSLGINVIEIGIKPWRFEDARNASLSAIPLDIDYCIALDMDEVLLPGWKKELKKAFDNEWTRPRYQYTWSWNEDGTPGLQYGGDKIHSRKHYRWKHPVHEVLTCYGQDEIQGWVGLEIHHHADNTKPRSQYLPLLALSVQEDPNDDRNAFYYGRELYFYNMKDLAAAELKRHLSLPRAVWAPERAASMRYIAKCEPDNAKEWYLKAIDEAPGRREALVDLSLVYYNEGDWENCYKYSKMACDIKEKPLEYLCEAEAWGWMPHDLLAISAFNLKYFKEAFEAGQEAYNLNPEERLAVNLEHYKNAYNPEDDII